MKKLFLLDGSSYIYRAFYAVRDLATSSGLPTNAIHGFAKMLLALIAEHRPDYLGVVFDRPRAELFRTQIYPDYKANRESMPEGLVPQVPYIKRLVEALNIPAIEVPTFEADDVIATLAQRYADQELEVVIVSGDKDLMQCVRESVSHLDTMKGQLTGFVQVAERFGVAPDMIPEVLGLAGDSSDNIPGVPGIGEKTAIELLQKHKDLEGVLKWCHLVSGKKRQENLRVYADQARLSKELATLRQDAPITISLEEMRRTSPDLGRLLPLFNELDMQGLATAFTPPAPGVVEIYSDGSAMPDGRGGYGVILRYGAHEKELSGHVVNATSQRMELIAAIEGLSALKERREVRLVSDSQYLVNGMTQWVHGWIRTGRLDAEGELPNQDLWKQLVTLSSQQQITWEWVKGHAGHPFNERCDKLARQAIAIHDKAAMPLERPQEAPEPPAPTKPALPPRPLAPAPILEGVRAEESGQLSFC